MLPAMSHSMPNSLIPAAFVMVHVHQFIQSLLRRPILSKQIFLDWLQNCTHITSSMHRLPLHFIPAGHPKSDWKVVPDGLSPPA